MNLAATAFFSHACKMNYERVLRAHLHAHCRGKVRFKGAGLRHIIHRFGNVDVSVAGCCTLHLPAVKPWVMLWISRRLSRGRHGFPATRFLVTHTFEGRERGESGCFYLPSLAGKEHHSHPTTCQTISDERITHIATGSGCIETSSSAFHAHQPPHIQAECGQRT